MELVALPAFTDNYIWMIHDGRQAVVVDPGDATPVLEALSARGLTLAAILVTHRHADHVAGLSALQPHCDGPIIGPAGEPVDHLTRKVVEGDTFELLDHHWTVWDTPGHTAGHVTYIALAQTPLTPEPALVWCGDTLFSGGCGRVFDGTHEQLMRSLQRLADLPEDTRLLPTHEYTLANLRFALAVEPANDDIRAALDHDGILRSQGQPTLPTTVGRERLINPFIRLTEPDVIAAARARQSADDSPLGVFTALRQWKNAFTA